MATAVFDRFTGAAPEKSLGRTKPGAQPDSRRYQLPITDRSRRCRRLLITDYRSRRYRRSRRFHASNLPASQSLLSERRELVCHFDRIDSLCLINAQAQSSLTSNYQEILNYCRR
jgi:hypothetical protein